MGIGIAIFILLILLLSSAGIVLVRIALLRKDSLDASLVPKEEREKLSAETEGRRIIARNTEEMQKYSDEVFRNAPWETVSITSSDGLRLEADFIPSGNHRYALIIHGYKCDRKAMYLLSSVFFHEWGFSLVIPDCRSHGKSEGRWIGMGWLEKDDIKLWCEWITKRDPEAEIILFGVSMGAAAVMMASGLNLPSSVKAAVEDCGYTSAWEIFRNELRMLYHLPAFPLLCIFSFFSRIIAGYTPKEASSLRMLKKSELPMLFIHGGSDHFVSTSMLDECFQAKIKGWKEKLIIPDAGHAEAYLRDPQLYFSTIRNFIEKEISLKTSD